MIENGQLLIRSGEQCFTICDDIMGTCRMADNVLTMRIYPHGILDVEREYRLPDDNSTVIWIF